MSAALSQSVRIAGPLARETGAATLGAFYATRLSELSAVDSRDVAARMIAFSKAIADYDNVQGIPVAGSEESLREDIILQYDERPELAQLPSLQRLVDPVSGIRGVAATIAKIHQVFAQARAAKAYFRAHQHDAREIAVSDTQSFVYSLVNVSDAIGDTTADPNTAVANGWAAEGEAVADYSLDSTTSATLAATTMFADNLDYQQWLLSSNTG